MGSWQGGGEGGGGEGMKKQFPTCTTWENDNIKGTLVSQVFLLLLVTCDWYSWFKKCI